nr:uncharacterized protein LOC128705472 [Cherax quadricarinatus]
MTSGIGLGNFMGPLLIEHLQDEYSFQGATMILGAILLHGFVGTTLYQPVQWHMKYPNVSEIPQTMKMSLHRLVGSLTTLRIENLSKNNVKTTSLPQEENNEDVTKINFNTTSLPKKKSQDCFCKLFSTILRVLRGIVKDMTILRHPPALILALEIMLNVGGEANFNVLVPFTIQAAGYSLQTAAWCLSVAGICNFFSRLTVSFLSDYSWFSMRLCYLIGLATMSTAIIGVVRDASGSYIITMWVLSAMIFTSCILWLFMPAAQAYDQRLRKEIGRRRMLPSCELF